MEKKGLLKKKTRFCLLVIIIGLSGVQFRESSGEKFQREGGLKL